MLLGGDLGVTMMFPLLLFLLFELRVGMELLLSLERRARQGGAGVMLIVGGLVNGAMVTNLCQGQRT